MSWRVGVDIGGTFTDFALLDTDQQRLYLHKQLTTPDDPAQSVLSGLPSLVNKAGISLVEISTLVHGTTLVTNAVIERRGAPTAMLVTAGFADVLDIARERRYDMYDLGIAYPPALIPRSMRVEVKERIDERGHVVHAPDLSQLQSDLERLVGKGIEAVAICLLNSPLNSSHEEQIARLIRERFPQLYVSMSAEVFPFLREYERWNTACMNAYTGPLLDRYLASLQTNLTKLGFSGDLLIMASSGGMVTPELARRFPVRMLESGPAAGVLQSAALGAQLGRSELLAFDMGGTTAKGALIRGGQAMKRHDMEVARIHEFKAGSGLPVRIPVIDLIEIGAGGGSLARIDDRGALVVGPRSAGASPGPICYKLGGEQPALTDANLVLGYLDADFFLGGAMKLDRDAALAGINHRLASRLGVTPLRAAWGIHESVSEDVARAFRNHASERGFDYRACAMVAFGGSGPAHACRVARKLRVPTVIFPVGAGVMSAIGLLSAPLSFEVFKADRVRLDSLTTETYDQRWRDLLAQARAELSREPKPGETEVIRKHLDMRYRGQGYELEVALPDDAPVSKLRTLFETTYSTIFGKAFPDQAIEITNWKLALSLSHAAQGRPARLSQAVSGRARKGTRSAWDPEGQSLTDWPVFDRAGLLPGDQINGPALIEESESTCVIGRGDLLTVDAQSNLIVSIGPMRTPS
ncbi:MAG: hypothetical protein RLZZ153_2195 [Pseudomonadota bacterium]|jgi:N-methylhydantoinase A